MKNNSKMLELLLSGKIDDLEKALKENIQEENNKKAGTKKEATIIKKFLKHVKNRKDLNGAFKIDGSFYFCNMYSVLKSCNDYGFEHVEGFKNAKNMFSQKFDKKITVDIADIKTFLAIEKAASKAEKRTMSPYINHINYKLRNYGFSYAGKWSYIKNGFDYTDTSNKERRILRSAKCAIYNFIDELRGVA